MNPFVLALIGLLLIFLEFYLPGAVMGTVGVLMLISAVVIFAVESQSPLQVILFIAAIAAALVFLVRFTLRRIRKTGKDNTIYLERDQEGYVASAYDADMIGKNGVALTDLKPSGHALIEGRRYQVMSQGGYIVEGTAITVVTGEGPTLFVKQTSNKDKSS